MLVKGVRTELEYRSCSHQPYSAPCFQAALIKKQPPHTALTHRLHHPVAARGPFEKGSSNAVLLL